MYLIISLESYLIAASSFAENSSAAEILSSVQPQFLIVGLMSGLLAADWVEGTLRLLLGVTLIYASLVDLRRYVIPVQAIAVVALLGIARHVVERDWAGLGEGAVAAVLAAAVFEGLRQLSGRLRGVPALGFGDGPFVGALAIWLGQHAVGTIGLAAAALLVLRLFSDRRSIAAFGWALSVVAFNSLAISSLLARNSAP